jgi:hypothetical protein
MTPQTDGTPSEATRAAQRALARTAAGYSNLELDLRSGEIGGGFRIPDVVALARRLRGGDPPVVARIRQDQLLLDPRTLTDEEATEEAAAVRRATR